jgi:hypothetical protein
MKNSKLACGLEEEESRLEGLSISFDEEIGITLKWDEDSPYANICRAIEQDNSLLLKMLENHLDKIDTNV